MYVPEAKKTVSRKTKAVSGRSHGTVEEIKAELRQLKEDLVKKNRDRDDEISNLTLGNFSQSTRKKLDAILNTDKNETTDENGGTE